MSDVTDPVGLPTGVKERMFRVTDWMARNPRGQRWFSKAIEVGLTSIGAGNHDYTGDRTGENRLIGALNEVLPDLVALDIGANRGSWTLEVRARCPRSRVIAVEPGAAAAESLRARVADDGRVAVVQCAVSDEPGEARLYGTARAGDLASLLPDLLSRTTYGDADPSASSELVELRTLNQVLGEARTSGLLTGDELPTVIKVDTEGYEFPIVRQMMTGALAEHIRVIQFEFNMHSIAQGQMIDDFAGLIGEDFMMFRLAPRALIPRQSLGANLANYFGFSNWVALRNEIAPGVQAAYRAADPRMRRRPEWCA